MWWQISAALLGMALMAAPDALGLPEPAASFVNVVAPIATAFAIVAASEVTRGVRYAACLSGAALAVGTVVLGVPMPELLLVAGGGVAMAILALGGGRTRGSYGGGWSALR